MDLSAALPTFLITLREGVEAALVVGIVLALLKKVQQSWLNPWVYAGIFAGLGASALVGLLFKGLLQTLTNSSSPYAPVMEPFLEGVFTCTAIALLSWMLVWMTRQAQSAQAEVEGALTDVLQSKSNAGWGIFGLIFIAVLREGFETVVFIVAKFQQGWVPVAGALAGIVGATGIGVLLFRWGVKINLRRFFQIMGIFLLLIVSGLVISALQHFDVALGTLTTLEPQFADICFGNSFADSACMLGPLVWNGSEILPDKEFPGIFLKTLLGYRDHLYLIQAIAYCLFLGITGTLYLQSLVSSTPSPTPQPESGESLTNITEQG